MLSLSANSWSVSATLDMFSFWINHLVAINHKTDWDHFSVKFTYNLRLCGAQEADALMQFLSFGITFCGLQLIGLWLSFVTCCQRLVGQDHIQRMDWSHVVHVPLEPTSLITAGPSVFHVDLEFWLIPQEQLAFNTALFPVWSINGLEIIVI